jgi:hypothetical protein
MEITKKHSTEIYKDEQHGHHQKNIAQKYIKMSNMDITKKHKTKKYIKKSNMDITKKHNKEKYKDEQHGQHQKT